METEIGNKYREIKSKIENIFKNTDVIVTSYELDGKMDYALYDSFCESLNRLQDEVDGLNSLEEIMLNQLEKDVDTL